jgi:hypothetical protein
MKTMTNLTKTILILVLSAGLFSCKNKDPENKGGGGPFYGYGNIPGAYRLQTGEMIIAQPRSEGPQDFPLQIFWQISGEAYRVQQLQWSATSIAKSYQGQVVARGTMTIPFNYNSMGCMIPAGQYQVASTGPGMWNFGVYQFQSLTATNGAVTINMSMNGIVIDPNGDGQVDHLSGSLRIMNVYGGGYGGAVGFSAMQNCFVGPFTMF